jgi:acyl carrier protein
MNAEIEFMRHSPVCEKVEDTDSTRMTTELRPVEVVTFSVPSEIYARVTNVFVEVLVVDRKRVTPTAALQRELSADSLDVLEIMFRLEQEFGIEIARGELFPDSIFRIDPEMFLDGKLTDNGLAQLRSRLPFADLSSYQDDRRMSSVSDLITVGLVAKYIAWKLGCCAGAERVPTP